MTPQNEQAKHQHHHPHSCDEDMKYAEAQQLPDEMPTCLSTGTGFGSGPEEVKRPLVSVQ